MEDENDKRANSSLDGHRRVLAAVKNGDGDAARNAMMKHLEEIEKIIFHG
jgi:DNA-binding FadR family transcriptional regulator